MTFKAAWDTFYLSVLYFEINFIYYFFLNMYTCINVV